MKKFLARMFGLGGKDEEDKDDSAPAPLPSRDFAPSTQAAMHATHALSMLEMRLKEEQTVESIKKMFRDSGRTMATAMEPQQNLELLEEKYSRIWKMIVLMWGTRELHRKLQEILYIDTEGRAGFPFDVVAVLMRVYEMHATEYGFGGGVHQDDTRRGLSSFLSPTESARLKKKEDASVKEASKEVKRDRW